MSELSFAKSYLGTLDARTTKYQPDHVFDPKTFQLRVPFTLPRLQHPPHPLPPKTTSSSSPPPGATPSTPSLTIILKSSRNPTLSMTLADLPPSTTISQLKESVQHALGGPTTLPLDKIKILFNKKPIASSKNTVAEALAGSDAEKQKEVDFGIMVLGGAPDPVEKAAPPAAAPTEEMTEEAAPSAPMEGIEELPSPSSTPAQGPSGKEVLETEAFWNDLQGFLEQRLKDEAEASRLRKVFQGAFKTAGAGKKGWFSR